MLKKEGGLENKKARMRVLYDGGGGHSRQGPRSMQTTYKNGSLIKENHGDRFYGNEEGLFHVFKCFLRIP